MVQNRNVEASAERITTLVYFSSALQLESHVLKDRLDLLWQQLYNRLQLEPEPLPPNLIRRGEMMV